MTQPALGLIASVLVVTVSLAYISRFDAATFNGPVSFLMLCLIPIQIVVAVIWGANPALAASLRQPAKGLVLMVVTIAAAVVIAPLTLQAVGEGVMPPGPIPVHFAIIAVPTTFWLTIMLGGWPFTSAIKNPLAAGLVLLIAAYLVTYACFRLFFNYDFLQGSPVYLGSAPHGLYDAVTALVFYVTALPFMFLVLGFDLWPFTLVPEAMKQPALGLLWTLVALVGSALALLVGIGTIGMDPLVFLTRVTTPIIFGNIVVLNMLENSLVTRMSQPLKGTLTAVTAAALGVALASLYGALVPILVAPLASGPPSYDYEVWLANALLSVTFPFLIFYALYFDFWPLRHQASSHR
jgi:hypothetical protein